MRKLIATAAVLITVLPAVGCSIFGRTDSNRLAEHVRGMPGVANVASEYQYNFTTGERFDLTVTLRPEITEQQLRDVGAYFADTTRAEHLLDNQTDLNLHLPKVPPPPKSFYVNTYHTASFSLGRGSTAKPPTGKDIGDGAAAWLHAARAPVVADVLLVAPTWSGGDDSRRIAVTLGPEATQAQALALQASDPALAGAEWGISIPTEGVYRPHDYFSTPRPPSDPDLDTWRAISAFIGPKFAAAGNNQVPLQPGAQAETMVEFSLPGGPDAAEDARIAFGVAELLRRFDRPVAAKASSTNGSVELIVGGCYRHDPRFVPGPLRTALASEFERC